MSTVSRSPLFAQCGVVPPGLPAAAGPLAFPEFSGAAEAALRALEAILAAGAVAADVEQGVLSGCSAEPLRTWGHWSLTVRWNLLHAHNADLARAAAGVVKLQGRQEHIRRLSHACHLAQCCCSCSARANTCTFAPTCCQPKRHPAGCPCMANRQSDAWTTASIPACSRRRPGRAASRSGSSARRGGRRASPLRVDGRPTGHCDAARRHHPH